MPGYSSQGFNKDVVGPRPIMSSAPFRQRLALQVLTRRNRLKTAAAQGFTLIELLVVIVILGVLGAVGYSAYINQIGRANASTAQNTATALAKNCAALLATETQADADTAFQNNVSSSIDPGQVTVAATTCQLGTTVDVTVGASQPAQSVATITAAGIVTPATTP